MSPSSSTIPGRAARAAAVLLTLLTVALLAHGATAASSSTANENIAVSLVQSSTAVPLDGTFGFTGAVRLPAPATFIQARLQIHRPGGKLIYQRTQYESSSEEGTHTYSFSRQLAGLNLSAGSYPVTFSVHTTVGGSDIATEVATVLRVYDVRQRPVPVILLAKIHVRPLTDASGRFAVDPGSPAGARTRDEVERIAAIVSADSAARVTLAIPPVTIEEWRRIATNGYTTASGTVVPATDPVAVACGGTLTHLQQALTTGRLELLNTGYTDPNLADLDANKLVGDAAAQYDMGLSACFASLEVTPSPGTAPVGGCVPKSMQHALIGRHVGYAFADAESTRIGKRAAASGVYPAADSSLTVIVVDARASRELESGDASSTIAHTFERLGTASANQPVTLRIDLDDAVPDATATVGFALSTIEATPWTTLLLGGQAQPRKGTHGVTFVPQPTKRAPSGLWSTVRSARAHAAGMIAVLTASDEQATSAQTDSLLAEASAWSDPSAMWAQAGAGLAFANAALKTAQDQFDTIKLSALQVTLPAETGNVPVTIQNNSKKTLTVTVLAKTSGGISVVGDRLIPTRLPPRDTYVQIPVDMQSALYGRVTIQVMAGSVVVAKQTVTVRRSFLDRLAMIVGIVLVLGGMLVWIVLRVRTSPDIDDEPDVDDEGAEARYTESHPTSTGDSDLP